MPIDENDLLVKLLRSIGNSFATNPSHDAYLVQRILEMVQRDFTPQTIQIFQRVVLDAEDAQSIASDLQITANAVRIAQSRVLAALRRIGAGLLY